MHKDQGLSTGAEIAIGVAVPLCVLILAFLIACVCFRRQQRYQKSIQLEERRASHNRTPERQELGFSPRTEMEGSRPLYELENMRTLHELCTAEGQNHAQ